MSSAVVAYMVTASIVGLRLETGAVVEQGRTVPYVAEAGDRVGGDRVITRDGEPYGYKVSTPAGQPMVQTFDRFVPSPAETFLLGTRPGFIAARLGLGGTPPAADDVTNYRVWQLEDETPVASLDPTALWRKSKIVDTARPAPDETAVVVQHDIFLELPAPLEPGARYRVGIAHPAVPEVTFTYDTASLRSEAVHVSHIGFRPDDPVKAGYLSMWLGHNPAEPGADPAVAYAPGTPFRLLEVATGEIVFEGRAEMAEPRDAPSNRVLNYNQTDVLALDFSALDRPGEYVIEVEGVGTSFPFRVADDVWREAWVTAMQGFYHQRSGIALEAPHTDWARPRSLHPADGTQVRRSGATLMDTDQGLNLLGRKSFDALPEAAADERVPEAWGGWHDAGDWDRRAQHMAAVRDLLDLVELRPTFAAATPLRIPEAGNGLPDLLDEALWGVDFYARLQLPEGGVPGGIEGDAYPPRGETSWTSSQTLYVYGPDAWASYLFAGVAARAALLVEAYDPARAGDYRQKAIRAMAWAEANLPERAAARVEVVNARNLAAAELYRLTGDARWHDVFKASSAYAAERQLDHEQHQFYATLVYARTDRPVDAAIRERGIASVVGYADFLLGTGDRGGFGQLMNPWIPYGWSYTSALPVEADVLVLAHALTGDPRYFQALIGETQFGLGANPDNMTFTTGLGHRQPREVLLVDKYGMGGVPDGLTIFGGWNVGDRGQHWSFPQAAEHIIPRYPDAWPVHETHIGYFWAVPITEYTVHSTIARVAKAWGYIAASDAAGARVDGGGTLVPVQQRGDAGGATMPPRS
jgi:endoglucanase